MGSIFVIGTGYAARMRGWLRSRPLRRATIAVAFAPLLLGALAPAELVVEVHGLRNDHGLVHLCLTAEPRHFPDCQDDPTALRRSVPAAEAARITISAHNGHYALALVHDENGNGRMDTFLGMPREGFGFSRDAPVRFGPPRFEDARFTLEGSQTLVVTIRYLL
jgi:uncharacterized protein (DUF2141 family)